MSDIKNTTEVKFIIDKNEEFKIEEDINHEQFIIRCSDNLAKLVSNVEKLTSDMFMRNIKEIALNVEVEIFKVCTIEKFKN